MTRDQLWGQVLILKQGFTLESMYIAQAERNRGGKELEQGQEMHVTA